MTRPIALDRDGQRAFTGLLARPLVTAATDPALYGAVARHATPLSRAARLLGYRLAASGQAFRLVRVPVAGTVTAPPPPPGRPGRRVLALACVLAAACDQLTGPVTLARLAGLVQELTSGPGATVAPFDPALLAHGRQLAEAAVLLEHWGVLRPRPPANDDDANTEYDIDQAALDLLTSPDVLSAALAPAAGVDPGAEDRPGTSRPARALRALVETPAVLYADLAEDDAAALRATRGLRSSEAAGLTGGRVEARAEGLIMIIDDEPPSPVTSDWPGGTAAGRASLLLADAAGRAGERQPDGTVTLTSDQADEQASVVPAAVRAAAEQQLAALGLLRIRPDGGWVLSPVAGRYRATDGQP
ncbi:MAG TPA: DUF2398 family protein [Streptosporangiaceae bacterium]|jgi:uncharacterized protein (TIGR02678 family)|nr:DUF2398 family protein [Streptosporangiaceae bacterium]